MYVLTSRHTFSSGSWFATVLHDNDLATLVGEPTGGAPGHYGDVLSFTLPESGLSYTLSFKCFVRPDPSRNPATSLTPDVRVPMTRAALMGGTDPVLEHVRGLGR
ncbi:MAG: S41 family peptidase [Planctomycetota bacterium]